LAENENSRDLYMIIKEKKSAVISVDLRRGNYNTENRALGRDAKTLF